MEEATEQQTSVTLLGRLRLEPADGAAWALFVLRYGPLIRSWCRRWGLQDADAEDVAQAVLLRLADKLRTFQYDAARSFRGWLRTIAHHAWCDLIEGNKR